MEKFIYQKSLNTIKKSDVYREPRTHLLMFGSWRKFNQESSFYAYTIKERIAYTACGVLLAGVFALIFYKSWIAFFVLFPLALLYPSYCHQSFKKRKQNQLSVQFKEMMLAVATALNTGYSVENAFREAYKEVKLMYGKQTMIVQELERLVNGLELGWSIEALLEEFAVKSEIEDIQNFSEVFQVASKSGGNLCNIIRQTTETIEEKMRVQEEIITATTAAQYESMLMQIIPLLIILYMNVTGGDFFNILYESLLGRLFMTGCLLAYIGIVFLNKKIMEKQW